MHLKSMGVKQVVENSEHRFRLIFVQAEKLMFL